MKILGISAFYHDSAACLVIDGEIIAAAQEERFTRIKHDEGFPKNAIKYCLMEAGLIAKELDYVVFYEKPFLKFDRLLENYIGYAPRGFKSFSMALPVWLKQKLFLPREIDKGLGGEFDGPIIFPEHHQSHAASAFFPSPFKESAILTIDGVGEWTTTSLGIGRGNKIELIKQISYPHSLGMLYSAFTYYTGFKVNSGEYKVMGLAPYGRPVYEDLIFKYLIDVKDDGSYRLNMDYFNYCEGLTMTNSKFDSIFGGPPRKPETEMGQKEMDLASSVQAVTEKVMLKMVEHALETTGMENLCLAGGVSLNCVSNGKLLKNAKGLKRLFIQPAAGDAGGALGAAIFASYQLLDAPRYTDNVNDSQFGSLLGPKYGNNEIEKRLNKLNAKAHFFRSDDQLCNVIAEKIDEGKIIGLFCNRMEFGPRALGARSIIGDPRKTDMQKKMNLKIKFRESFRPFAPCVLEEDASKYFDIDCESPYMLIVAGVNESIRKKMSDEEERMFGIEKLNSIRSEIPAITHVDYSARIQTVNDKSNPRLYSIMKSFKERSGCSVIVNTSFNVRGEPIVNTPEEAFNCFMFTHMDVLVLENHILFKNEQEYIEGAEEHLAKFELD